jgi:arylsulfatase A-like enzyme
MNYRLEINVGKIFKTLQEEGLEENTFDVLLSAIGGQSYLIASINTPFNEQKGILQEDGIRVPFAMKWPGNLSPVVSDARLCQVDMKASFAEFLHDRLPAGAAPDNENYLDIWLNKGRKGREYLVLQTGLDKLLIENRKWKYTFPCKDLANNQQTNTELENLDQDKLYV